MILTARQIGELDARDFLGDDTWKKWKKLYDDAMSYRKSLKGKPTDEQRVQLQANADWIAFCDQVLFHSARLAAHGRCTCRACDAHRKENAR